MKEKRRGKMLPDDTYIRARNHFVDFLLVSSSSHAVLRISLFVNPPFKYPLLFFSFNAYMPTDSIALMVLSKKQLLLTKHVGPF